ncbi:quinoprotein [Oceanicola sp. 22II-s10i]|nr:quinoprotein [Oceanicola sp. 22II-s10i]
MRVALIGAVALLAACDEREVYLPGKRENVRDVLATEAPGPGPNDVAANRSVRIALPRATMNAEWLQRPGTPSTRTAHPALAAAPRLAWSAPIGAGDSRRNRITASPVVMGGRVFTLDAEAQVTATSTAGQTLWQTNLVPPRERGSDATGGGLAAGGGLVYVSSGFGTLTALDPASGGIAWQQKLEAVGNGSPTYFKGVVYLVSGDATGWAIDPKTGRVLWQITSAAAMNDTLGGPAPALTETYAIFPFSSGQIIGAFRKGGLRQWEGYVSGRRAGYARANVGGITGDPVVVGDTVYVGSQSGRLVAMNVGNGEPVWTANEGPQAPVTVIGGSVFMVSDRNELLRLDAATGERIWGVELPFFTSGSFRRQHEIFVHYGPVVAGGQVIIASNDGLLRFFDPASGAMTRSVEIPGGATVNPVVAGGTLYVVSSDGKLLAYR